MECSGLSDMRLRAADVAVSPDCGSPMTTFEPGLICERWKLVMPDFRVKFHAERHRWELGRLEHMAERVKPGMVVYDVGAECGDFTSLYRSWGATVIPIEPMPAMWPSIRATWEANGYDLPPACFAGFAADHSSRVLDGLYVGTMPGAGGAVVADPGFRHLAYRSPSEPCVTLSDLAEFVPMPDVLAIDVEGSEWHVLDGARRVLRVGSPLVYVSVHPPTMRNWYNRTPTDLHMLMSEYGYVGRQLPHWGEAEEFWFWEKP